MGAATTTGPNRGEKEEEWVQRGRCRTNDKKSKQQPTGAVAISRGKINEFRTEACTGAASLKKLKYTK